MKVTIVPVGSLLNPTSAESNIDANFDRIEQAIENTLSRDGTQPNEMLSHLDMNAHDIYNVRHIDTGSIFVGGRPVGTTTRWWVGAGNPSPDLGGHGDLYLDTNNNNVWSKETDGWELVGNITGEGSGFSAVYQDQNTLKDLGVNDTLTGGGFPGVRSPEEELIDNFAISPGRTPQTSVDLGTCLLMPPTEESLNFVAPTVPYMTYEGQTSRFIPLDIRTILHNTPISYPLFKPVEVNGSGILVWEYIGEKPMHVLLQGGFEVAVRTGATVATPWSRVILTLRSWDYPLLEDGQNNGRRHLATSLGALQSSQRFNGYDEFNDWCGPITQEVLDSVAAHVERWPGDQNGFFNPGDNTEALRTSDDDGPVGPEVRTSNWIEMDSNGIDPAVTSFVMQLTGTSSRSRVQFKRADGSIDTYDNFSREATSRRIYRLPVDATAFRIYFSGRGDTASNMSIKSMSNLMSAEYDYLKGFWSRRQFNVHRDVVFWPGTKYALCFDVATFDNASARNWGFRFQGGGLSFNFDAGDIRKDRAGRFF